ncbi:MAG: glycosyltransferase [Abitibacteriaceae bacterium]|nr:glycosyltransferase [Abditibacteriaceae bacterium]
MRVLHILEATQGGTRRHILDLLPALQARGIHCDLACSFLRNPQFVEDAACLSGLGVGIYEVPMQRGWGGSQDIAAWRALRTHLQTRRYDLIHCHSSKAGFIGRLLQTPGRGNAIPVVYTPHCIAFDTGLPRPQRRAARIAEKLLAPLTAHFIAVARHEWHMFKATKLCPPNRATVIYNGIDVRTFDTLTLSPPHPLTPSPSAFTIGCFGRLTRQKNQVALLHAFAQIKQEVQGAQLMLIGGGEDEAKLRGLANQLCISKSVQWVGEVAEARPYYALCDVIAQPSRWEGCPYSILEAMTARRPVVATAVGGVQELLTCGTFQIHSTGQRDLAPSRVGITYKPAHPAALASNLTQLAQNKEVRAMLGNTARHRVEEEFTLEQMVEKTVKVYEQVTAF